MDNLDKIVVEKTYFDALLRRANFHTQAALPMACVGVDGITIPKSQYDHLILVARQFDHLKNALIQGGVAPETLTLLIGDSCTTFSQQGASPMSTPSAYQAFQPRPQCSPSIESTSYPLSNYGGHLSASTYAKQRPFAIDRSDPRHGPVSNLCNPSSDLSTPDARHTSYGLESSVADTMLFEGYDEGGDEAMETSTNAGGVSLGEKNTLFFHNLPSRVSYADLLSIIRGSKVVSAVLRPEGAACVTLLDNAAEFLAWSKRNDIYLHGKRIEVRWANRQYRIHNHIRRKVDTGATRNIVVQSATEKGLTESRIRADLDHIYNLAVVDLKFRNGNAYVSTNSVHSALFARTCMLSRLEYKGCKIESFPDECDVPLTSSIGADKGRIVSGGSGVGIGGEMGWKSGVGKKTAVKEEAKRTPAMTNRFNLLSLDGDDGTTSDGENQTPPDFSEEEE